MKYIIMVMIVFITVFLYAEDYFGELTLEDLLPKCHISMIDTCNIDTIYRLVDNLAHDNLAEKGYHLNSIDCDTAYNTFGEICGITTWNSYNNLILDYDYADTIIVRGGMLEQINDSTYIIIEKGELK